MRHLVILGCLLASGCAYDAYGGYGTPYAPYGSYGTPYAAYPAYTAPPVFGGGVFIGGGGGHWQHRRHWEGWRGPWHGGHADWHGHAVQHDGRANWQHRH